MNQRDHRKTGYGKWWWFGLLLIIAYIAAQFQPSQDAQQTSLERLPVNSQTVATDTAVTTDVLPKEIPSGTNLRYDLLREVGLQEFVSPAGLRYTRGSEEGHRLDHLARHLEDQPDRPGRHGVFEGDMRQVLLWLDEAYGRAASKEKGTSVRQEDRRTIIETTFDQRLGYIGGREGRRIKNPSTKRLRLVVDKDRVITAFPF